MLTKLRLSGTGGQGLILAGIIMADAAIRDGLNSTQSQSYGPEARGGASRSEVIIADDEIDYPRVSRPNVLLVMSQEAYDKFGSDLDEDSIVVVDTTYIDGHASNDKGVYKLPISLTAKEELGRELVSNIVALGALVQLTGVVSREALEEALLTRIPSGTEELNKKALEFGRQLAKKECVVNN